MTKITTSELEVRYGKTVALTCVNIEIPAGSLVCVIGANGAGKSAFLKALAGTVELHRGEVSLQGSRPSFVLQSTDVDPSLPISVRDVVSLARYPIRGIFKRFQKEDHDAIENALDRLNIRDLEKTQFHELSGGQRQRVLLAQGLAQDSNVMLLDEPITGLDVVSRNTILEMIYEEVKNGRTVIFSSHNLHDASRSDQVLLLKTIPICYGPPDEVLTEINLRSAFGEHHIRVGEQLLIDDPHHDHTSTHEDQKVRTF
jgi:iron complex transport system ATP-binding protein